MLTELEKLKIMLSPSDLETYSDELLLLFLEDAEYLVNDIRKTEELEVKYKPVVRQIVIERINKMGAEGQLSHSETDITRTWSSADISKDLLARITPVMD